MNSKVVSTEIVIDKEPKRGGNAKLTIDFVHGELYQSGTDFAIATNTPQPTASGHCRNGIGACYVKDMQKFAIEIAATIKALYEDATKWRELKAEEERIEAERKAKEEAERKRVKRIAELEERAMTMATEMDAINAELVRLRTADTITREMAKGFCADLQGTYKRNYWVPLRVIADDMQWTLERAKEICDALVDFGMIEREGNAYKL